MLAHVFVRQLQIARLQSDHTLKRVNNAFQKDGNSATTSELAIIYTYKRPNISYPQYKEQIKTAMELVS